MNKQKYVKQTGYDSRYKTWHTINRNMILYIHSGSGSIVSGERNYPITPGCLCFVGSNKFYYTLPNDPEKYIRSKLFLSNEQLQSVLSLFPEFLQMHEQFNPNSLVYAQMKPEDRPRIEQFFHEIAHQTNPDYYYDALNYSNYIQLLITIHENATDVFFPSAGMLQKAVEYINNHIHEQISIGSVCAEIHVSKYYFCRKFKQATGYTVMEYILKTRIILAKNMLENTKTTIGEISERCGFSSQSYFCRVFKEETGITPLQYQKQRQSKTV